ncbi:MAG: 1-acyl-sn-glycerol-3-phosphate acyltransferase [Alistipes sp.]|nr:1-acyl-sn-glycerol-3-phosphate acyltransferase [Alistipes senegalensis]MCM1250117.1 1-acyl-sn-glycerol-3-phosphate acyltransferase [Alistipes sp.]
MLSALYYLFLIALCTVFMVLSAVALLLCWPFDRARRVVHELSRILVRIFFFIPPFWRQRVIGGESIDRRKSYVIVLNHNTVIDIPALYYLPLNFRWVSKREVFRVPFFGQFLVLHGDICIDRGRAAEARDQMVRKGCEWLGRGASVAVFPEGTRSKDGEIHRFKTGAFALAKEAGVEILPVVLDGTASLIRRNLSFDWGNRIVLRVLPPVSAERVAATDVHVLAQQVHDDMAAALAEIRNEKLKMKN